MFVEVAGNPAPEGAQALDFAGRDGLKLRGVFAPAKAGVAPRGSVILCNGRTEYIEKYFEALSHFQGLGFAVFSLDWRGQGLSDRLLKNRLKGHLENLDDPAQDLADGLKLVQDRLPRPHILIAHSMGGGIALRGMQKGLLSPDAALFSAPMWGVPSLDGVNVGIAKFMKGIGAGGNFLPGVPSRYRSEPFEGNPVTSDAARYARNQALLAADARLQVAGATYGWAVAAANAIADFRKPKALAHLQMPISVVSAGGEVLVDNGSHALLAKALPNCKHVTIEGAKHELLMERDELRSKFLAEFEPLLARIPAGAPASAAPAAVGTPTA